MSGTGKSIADKARVIAERIASSEGLEVVEVEWKGNASRGVLRIFIDKPGGVTHADCETVAKQASVILDMEDVVPASNYHLEVSSPGLDRKLLKLDDFRRFAGKKANLKLRAPLDGKQRLSGRLAGVDGDWILLEGKSGEPVKVRHGDVQTARLVVEI
ncbi:MAG: ribosome maturation factor [Acidobacteria bacterium]|nr:ribosome maturation factor [Acidobacteriota bacterium]